MTSLPFAMNIVRRFLFLFLLSISTSAFANLPAASPANADRSRILLIPLDDRPPCLQWPVLMAPVAGAEIITPPRGTLGRFLTPGDPDRIVAWLENQDLDTVDAVIVSLDMLAYGGLVASRIHKTGKSQALRRLEAVEKLRRSRPDLPIYGFSIIMRLAPTADGTNDAWRGALERWAELSPQRDASPEMDEQVRNLEERIPPEVLSDYQRTRERNLAVNLAAIRLAETGVLDFLILGQDDAKLRGVHVADREALNRKIQSGDLSGRVALQPGADEVAMLLLARAMRDRVGTTPVIKAVYSSETGRARVAPFEDRPLHETVSLQIAAAGARETFSWEEADLIYYIFASRHEEGIAAAFAETVARGVADGHRAMVADIDTRGNVQGGSEEFTEALLAAGVFPNLYSHASWNTAGNTIGTALPQGILRFLARGDRSETAQARFLLHRLANDYAYHGLVRPEVNRDARERGMNTLRLTPAQTGELEAIILERVTPHFERFQEAFQLPGEPASLRITLPWNRTFEAEIDFTMPENRND